MTKKLGISCMAVGAVLIVMALSLFLYNRLEDRQAGEAADSVLPELQAAIEEAAKSLPQAQMQDDSSVAVDPNASAQMPETEINGYAYIGYLSLPSIDLELPVMSQWDDERLRIAPCRHTGSVDGDDLVIAGHNYDRHFGRLTNLKQGDLVFFTDLTGTTTAYSVVMTEVLDATAIHEMLNSSWALTLYTCTYGGQDRVAVRCERMEQ